MAKIPDVLREPERLADKAQDLDRDDYELLVQQRTAAWKRRAPDTGKVESVLKAARAEQDEAEDPPFDFPFERVIDETNFLPSNFLDIGAVRARAICRIEIQGSNGNWHKWGTGFLIAPGLLMTNNHVFEEPFWAAQARLLFLDELDDQGLPRQPEVFRLDPDRLFITNSKNELDFTIVAVEGRPGDKYGYIPLDRDPHKVSRHEHVNIIQHPDGRPKEVVVQDSRVERVKSTLLLYRADTQPGSSGSPVFNNAWKLVGLHHAGGERDASGTWLNNEGIRISSIVRYIEEKFLNENNESANEVLSNVEGFNPYEGIFGLHGRKPVVREEFSPLERVVYSYHGTDAFLDTGFWNIKHFNDSSSVSRRRQVADLLEQLSLDAVGLVEVSEEPVRWVVEELNRRGYRYGYLMHDVRGAQDLAIIYDALTVEATAVKWPQEAKDAFDEYVGDTGKRAWYRHPMLARLKTKASRTPDEEAFDFLMCVVHAKATTHYDQPGVPEQVRREAAGILAQTLEKQMQDLGEDDLMIGGDFNAELEEGSFRALGDTFRAVALTAADAAGGDPDAYTYLGTAAGLIDHIYITPGADRHYDPGSISLTRIDRDIPDFYRDVSDHAPVIARFTFRGEMIEPNEYPEERAFAVAIPSAARNILLKREG